MKTAVKESVGGGGSVSVRASRSRIKQGEVWEDRKVGEDEYFRNKNLLHSFRRVSLLLSCQA